MSPDPDFPPFFSFRLSLLRGWGWTVLSLRRATSLFARPVGIALLWSALLLMGISAFLPPLLLAMIALGVWGSLFVLFWRGVSSSFLPTPERVDRWLEHGNQIFHRPLQVLSDHPFSPPSARAAAFWQRARAQALSVLQTLRFPVPTAWVARRDPFALRLFLLLLLIVGGTVAGPEAPDRLRSGWLPPWGLSLNPSGTDGFRLTLTVTPPPYTNLPTVTLHEKTDLDSSLLLRPGSVVVATLPAAAIPPALRVTGQTLWFNSEKTTATLRWTVPTTALADAGRLSVWDFPWRILSVPYRLIPDSSPHLDMTAPPDPLPDGRLRFHLSVQDDFGIEQLEIGLTGADTSSFSPVGLQTPEKFFQATALGGSAQAVEIHPVVDLRESFFAGGDAQVTLRVSDHLRQFSALPAFSLHLPERTFNDPAAQELAHIRAILIRRGPAVALAAADRISFLLQVPERLKGDPIALLAISSAAARLHLLPFNRLELRSVAATLWHVAVRLDGGGGDLDLALSDLQDAQDALRSLLNDPDASAAEVTAAMERLRQALARTLQTLAQTMVHHRIDPELQALMEALPESETAQIDADLLNDFLRQLEAEIKAGNRDKAREMMAQLQNFQEALSEPQTSLAPVLKALSEGISALQELVRQQHALLTQTRAQAQALEEDQGSSPVDTRASAEEQKSLRYILGEIMRTLAEKTPEVPENLSKAEMAMRASEAALAANVPGKAVPAQEESLRQLQKGQQQMAQSLRSQLRQMLMLSFGESGGGRERPGMRPDGGKEGDHGRPLPGVDMNVPEQTRERLRAILKTLRERAGENGRPKDEREYFERLLRQF